MLSAISSSNTTFSLPNVLNWINPQGKANNIHPFIAISELPSIPSDVVLALAISRILSTTPHDNTVNTLAIVGIKYSFQHIALLCKKIGQISLESYVKNGTLFFIDCLNGYTNTILDQENNTNQNDNASLSLPSYQAIFQRIALAHQITTQKQTDNKKFAFSVCIDDLSLLTQLNQVQDEPIGANYAAAQAFLTNLTRFTYPQLFHQYLTPNHKEQTNNLDDIMKNSTYPATLYFGVTAPMQLGVEKTPMQPSNLYKEITPQSILTPVASGIEVNAMTTLQFDLPVLNGGLTATLFHWFKKLGYILHSSTFLKQQQYHSKANVSRINTGPLFLELTTLSSGYSKDIFCQITIYHTPKVQNAAQVAELNSLSSQQQQYEVPFAINGSINIVFLNVDNNGELSCHARV